MSPTGSTKTQESDIRKVRAEKILETAGDLLLRFGYNRITIDDIAKYAGVGKGTIYLHWKTREDLFNAVVAREFSEVLDEMFDALGRDPEALLLHNAMRLEFLAVMRRPILRALFTADLDLMGSLAGGGVNHALDIQMDHMFEKYLVLMVENGLVRPDLNAQELRYAWSATTLGFFMVDPFSSEQFPLDLERKADLLADTMRRAFEIENDQTAEIMARILPRVIQLLTDISEQYHAEVRKAYE